MAARSGREVRTLLQATDTDLRADVTRPPGDGSNPVFVGGNPKQRGRAAVDAAVAAGVPLRVHGPFWEGTLPDGVLAGEYVANDRLMQLYRDHGLVLSDHWADMGRHGFLSNRLFDAVASGARVVSEPIDGLELFEGAVQPFHDADELALLCSPEGRSRFPDDDAMAAIADRVAREHSFDARAAVLLRDVAGDPRAPLGLSGSARQAEEERPGRQVPRVGGQHVVPVVAQHPVERPGRGQNDSSLPQDAVECTAWSPSRTAGRGSRATSPRRRA